MTIALLDVDYRASRARAACVLAESWFDEFPVSEHAVDVGPVEAYEPGSFYRRELPCLLAVLRTLEDPPDIAVVDGYVWLGGEARPGLGFHLYEALGGRTPVVGIAKTAFGSADAAPTVAKICRGGSKRPLFLTCVGVDLAAAGQWVRGMAGAHRVPSLLAAVDRLARSNASTVKDDA
jgi:deoxyribonuclease V